MSPQVCNLANDCGDNSDEHNCSNHFFCSSSEEYIPLTKLCDGHFDCSDNTDECGERCDTASKHLLREPSLKALSWVLGSLAVLLNSITLVKFPVAIAKTKSLQGKMDKMLVLLVSGGDFLMGGYLLAIATTDRYYGDRYCTDKFDWLTSVYCNLLGVFSTLASQLSLFSMTVLSVSRLVHIKAVGRVNGSSPVARVKLAGMCSLIVLFSAGISFLPLIPEFEDFFVNGLYYKNVTLFSGIVDKVKHQQILKTYNGRYRNQAMSWRNIGKMVREMFSEDFGGIQGRKVEFYGNDGVCIFKYLVSGTDPQYLFSITLLVVNFVCFIFITVSYLVIHSMTTKHSRKSNSKMSSAQRRRQRKFQTKISVIIITDFLCWIPFIVVCGLHFAAVIDASPWYPIFSIIILPVNSVINPLLYDDSVMLFCEKLFGRGSELIAQSGFVVSQVGDSQLVRNHSSSQLVLHSSGNNHVNSHHTPSNHGNSHIAPGNHSNSHLVPPNTSVHNHNNNVQLQDLSNSNHGNARSDVRVMMTVCEECEECPQIVISDQIEGEQSETNCDIENNASKSDE